MAQTPAVRGKETAPARGRDKLGPKFTERKCRISARFRCRVRNPPIPLNSVLEAKRLRFSWQWGIGAEPGHFRTAVAFAPVPKREAAAYRSPLSRGRLRMNSKRT